MNLTTDEIEQEKIRLKKVIKVIEENLSVLGETLFQKEEQVINFKQFIWENQHSMDAQEMRSVRGESDLEVIISERKANYFKKLFKIQNNPYFGSIVFKEDKYKEDVIYIGITYLENDCDEHLIYDWRSPVCSLFYDYEIGECSYNAPGGIIKGELIRKRQYKIKNGEMIHIFDNSVNIDDELLQEVLASESSEKMKNIVNTIQQEQNQIIRNIEDNNLIVQGIAGSGKTSVALHRIAFLLYKLENLSSKNILIFSPNQIFTEYISNVLPELGEDNTMQTTFHKFLSNSIYEYKNVESFVDFISRYYSYKEPNPKLVKYKQSDEIIEDLDNYLKDYIKSAKFESNLKYNEKTYLKEDLNDLLHDRYARLLFFDRIDEIALKLSEANCNGKKTKVPTFKKLLLDSLNIIKDFKLIYANFFRSEFCNFNVTEEEINSFISKDYINYEDACLFVYILGSLQGFDYNNVIKEVVIDEAQDYTKLQYIIIAKIFSKAGFTVLGDINQTINPYYKYESLEVLNNIFKGDTRYLELSKTYRSSQEIIEYTNKILNLSHVSAIRRDNQKPVLFRKEENNLKELLLKEISELSKIYKSIAIITKDDTEALKIYNLLKKDTEISLVNNETETFNKELIITPSYMAKGLEFDSVIVYNKVNDEIKDNEKYLYYVACTRAQHQLIIYN